MATDERFNAHPDAPTLGTPQPLPAGAAMDLRQRLARLTSGRSQTWPPSATGTTEAGVGAPSPPPSHAIRRPGSDADVAARLGGTVLDGGLLLIEERLPATHRHGRVALGGLSAAPLEALCAGSRPHPEGLLFLDTETTGLAGGTGTLPFLVGLARFDGSALCLRQYFLTGFAGERALLEHARPWLEASGWLVSYNGRSFDVPLLLTRHRLRRLPCPLDRKAHLDLLHPTRAAFASRWPDCRLQTAERRLLDLRRSNDLPGWQVPQVWAEFVRSGALGDLPRVMEHNRLDLVSLVALLAELSRVHAQPAGAADPLSLARHQQRHGREDLALDRLHANRHHLPPAGLLELARLHRRRGDWPSALAVLQPLAERGESGALLVLAKYQEHVLRDYRAALGSCVSLTARQPDEPAHRRRLARVQRKLANHP